MKYFVIAILVVLVACLTVPTCYALDTNDNGYKWNTSDMSERAALCKRIAGVYGRDYRYWVENLNGFYNTSAPVVLNKAIGDILGEMSWLQDKMDGRK